MALTDTQKRIADEVYSTRRSSTGGNAVYTAQPIKTNLTGTQIERANNTYSFYRNRERVRDTSKIQNKAAETYSSAAAMLERMNAPISRDQSARDSYGARNPEMTGGELGALLREINTSNVRSSAYADQINALDQNFLDYDYMLGGLAQDYYDEFSQAYHLESLEEQMDTAEDELKELENRLGSDNSIAPGSDAYTELIDAIRQKQSEYDALRNEYYNAENTVKLEAISNDSKLSGAYTEAQEAKSDADKVAAILMDRLNPTGFYNISGYKQEIADKYGISYNTDSLGEREDYYAALEKLQEELTARAEQSVSDVENAGYNYERLTGYEQALRDREEAEKKASEAADWARRHPVYASLQTIAAAPLQGAEYIGTMLGGIKNIGRPNTEYVPLNSANMDITNFVTTVRDTVSREIEENTDWELFGQNVASFLYQTGMSIGDSTLQVLSFGPGATYFMGASAASQKAKEIMESGGSNAQAFFGGLAAGAAEAFFEKFSVENLLKDKDITSFRRWLGETAKQMGTEGSEEVFTEIANMVSDAVIMGENSDFNRRVREYMEEGGMSEAQAKRQAVLDSIAQVALAGAGGALSGGIMGGVTNAFRYQGGSRNGSKARATDSYIQTVKKIANGTVADADKGLVVVSDTTPQILIDVAGAENLPIIERYDALYLATKQAGNLKGHYHNLGAEVMENLPDALNDPIMLIKLKNGRINSILELQDAEGNPVLASIELSAVKDFDGKYQAYNLILTSFGVKDNYIRNLINNPDNTVLYNKGTENIPQVNPRLNKLSGIVNETSSVDGSIPRSAENNNTPNGGIGVENNVSAANEAAELAATLGKSGSKAFVAAYDTETAENLDLPSAFRGFAAVYNAALNGRALTESQAESAEVLPEHMRLAAENAGQNDALEAKQAVYFGKDAGLVIDRNSRKMNMTAKDTRILDAIGKLTGIQIRFEENLKDSKTGKEANAKYDNGVVTISMQSDDPVRAALTHEIIHRIRETAPEAYNALAMFVHNRTTRDIADAQQQAYGKSYETDDIDLITEETVAEAFGTMMSDRKLFEQFVKDNRSAGQKILDYLHDLIAKIKRMLNGGEVELTREQREAFSYLGKDIEEMERVFSKALEQTSERVRSQGTRKDTVKASGDTRFSLKLSEVPEDINTFVDQAVQNKANHNYIDIALTTRWDNSAINKLGEQWSGKYTGGKRRFSQNYVRHVLNKHGNAVVEGLRGQLYMSPEAIKIALSYLREGKGRIVRGAYSRLNMPTIVTRIPVNGYTFYVEEPVKVDSDTELQGRTMYMAPTTQAALNRENPGGNTQVRSGQPYTTFSSPAALKQAEPASIPRKRGITPSIMPSIMPDTNIKGTGRIVNDILCQNDGNPAKLYYLEESGEPYSGRETYGLTVLTADTGALATTSRKARPSAQGYVRISNPYIVSRDNPIIKDSDIRKGTIAKRVEAVKDSGYDAIIMDYKTGDNYLVMVFDKDSVVKDTGDVRNSLKGSPAVEAARVWKNRERMTPAQIAGLSLEDADTTPKLTPRRPSGIDGSTGSQSRFYGSAIRSENIFDETRELISDMNDVKYYNGISNMDTLEKANDRLNAGGQAENNRFMSLKKGNGTAEDIAVGFILLKRYQDIGDYESAAEVVRQLRELGTEAGQTVQAFSVLGRLTPEGMAVYAQKELDEARQEMIKRKGEAWADKHGDIFQLTEEDIAFIKGNIEKASRLPDGRDKNILLAEIASAIEAKLPTNLLRQLKAWTRNAMLLNSKTMLRNVAGNAVMMPIYMVQDFVGSVADRLLSAQSGVRTTGATAPNRAALKAAAKGVYESFDDFRRGINTRQANGDRFDIGKGHDFHSYTREQRKAAGFPRRAAMNMSNALNMIDRLTGFLLEVGDRPFFEYHFVNSLNNQLRLNGKTEPTPEMIEIAANEAMQRTWQDDNGYTKTVSHIRNALNFNKEWGLGSIITPFTKTPANLTKALIEYSPAGLVKAIAYNAAVYSRSVKSKNFDIKTQKAFVDSLAKGITGTLTMALVRALVNAGFIVGGDDDEDRDAAAFKKNVMGIAPYSVVVNGKSYSYDWAQPLGGLFAITADYVQNVKNGNEPEVTGLEVLGAAGNAILNALSAGGNVLFEQSFLQGVSDLFANEGLVAGMIEAGSGVAAQFVPTALSQIAQIIDPYARTSFEYKDSVTTTSNQIKAKVPGLREDLAVVVDVLGNDVYSYGGNNSLFNVFFNPANIYSDTSTEVALEIYRVYGETGDAAVIPRNAPYYIAYKDSRYDFTSHERAKFQRTAGTANREIVKGLLSFQGYEGLSDEGKAAVLTTVVEYSNALAKKEYLEGKGVEYKRDSWMEKAENGSSVGLEIGSFVVAYEIQKNIEGLKDRNNETITNSKSLQVMEAIYQLKGLNDKQRQYLFESFDVSQSVRGYNKALVSEKLREMRLEASRPKSRTA